LSVTGAHPSPPDCGGKSVVRHRGPWQPGAEHAAGDGVQFGGALLACKGATCTCVPGGDPGHSFFLRFRTGVAALFGPRS
jgi:hypothetical protein